MKQLYRSYRDLLILTLAALVVGAVAGVVDAGLGHGLLLVTKWRTSHPYLLIPFLGFGGVLLLWGYHRLGVRRGVSPVFQAAQGIGKGVPLQTIPLAVGEAWLTHLFGGSVGRECAGFQVGGTLGYQVGVWLPAKNAPRILTIAGLAAGFAGLFRTPLAAAVLAVELLCVGALEYQALLPALAGACMASFISGLLGLPKFEFSVVANVDLSFSFVWKLVVLGIAFGILGAVFSLSLDKLTRWLRKRLPNPYVRILAGGILISIVSLICWGGRYSGFGQELVSLSLAGEAYPFDFVMKLALTALTLAVGFQGVAEPLFVIGAAFGGVLGPVLGLPPALSAALGLAAVFGSGTHTVIAPVLLGAEIFGFQYLPCFLTVCIANVCNPNRSIYPRQRKPGDLEEDKVPKSDTDRKQTAKEGASTQSL